MTGQLHRNGLAWTVAAFVALIGLAGCSKKPAESPEGPAAAPQKSPSPGAAASAPKPATNQNTVPGKAPSQALKLCANACNKAQSCATGRGAIAGCVARCLEVTKAADPDDGTVLEARGFAAQAACFGSDCDGFSRCVTRALVGEEAVKANPPTTTAEAGPNCHKLCEKESACHPKQQAQREGGDSACQNSCVQVFVADTAAMAAQRAIMRKSLTCVDHPCSEFEACVRAALVAR
ncbi:MAG: hypothetical protein ACI9WU_005041 [Myxococcota bacterium]|jgi:hypothetical protein